MAWERKAEILSQYMGRLKASGYGPKYRAEVLQSGMRGYKKMVDIQDAGGRRVNRHDNHNHVARKTKKLLEPKKPGIGGEVTIQSCLFQPPPTLSWQTG